jgi:hypothetical protein
MKMITLEDVYSWLNKYGISHIRPSSDYLIERINDALANNQSNKAKILLKHLKNLATKMQDAEEVSEVLIQCGRSAFRLGDLDEAGAILEDAISRTWSDLHRRAVVQWMLGCVQWESSDRQQAVTTWRNSLSDFERLIGQSGSHRDMHIWYEENYWKLDHSLIEALGEIDGISVQTQPVVENEQDQPAADTGKDQPPGGTGDAQPSGITEMAVPAPERSTIVSDGLVTPEPEITMTSDILQLYSVSEEIPAGDFGPSGVDPFPIGKIAIDCLSIDGRPYRIYNPRGPRVVNLPSDQKIAVVKVKGDSMNEENILPGDFVILRRVDMPANGDIVMAEIIDIDSCATLKRFFKEKDTITLQPHSSNPVHQPFVFKKVGEGFYIRGVVIAVLKPT